MKGLYKKFGSPGIQRPCWISHRVPWGQQCAPSWQQMALSYGQHPYFPVDNLQQVCPLAHLSDGSSGSSQSLGSLENSSIIKS